MSNLTATQVGFVEPTPIESVNAVSTREWIASMPLDVRVALAAIEETGMAVNEFEPGPIFYEVEVDFLSCSTSVGSVLSAVLDGIRKQAERYDVDSADLSAVVSFIREDSIKHSYLESMARLMKWVETDTSDWDDED